MLKKAIIFSTLIGLLFLTSCVPSMSTGAGRDFDPSYVSQIKRGKTTKSDIRSNIGEPSSVSTTGEGDSWMYLSIETGNLLKKVINPFSRTEGKHKQLHIDFKGDVVTDYRYTQGG